MAPLAVLMGMGKVRGGGFVVEETLQLDLCVQQSASALRSGINNIDSPKRPIEEFIKSDL